MGRRRVELRGKESLDEGWRVKEERNKDGGFMEKGMRMVGGLRVKREMNEDGWRVEGYKRDE